MYHIRALSALLHTYPSGREFMNSVVNLHLKIESHVPFHNTVWFEGGVLVVPDNSYSRCTVLLSVIYHVPYGAFVRDLLSRAKVPFSLSSCWMDDILDRY